MSDNPTKNLLGPVPKVPIWTLWLDMPAEVRTGYCADLRAQGFTWAAELLEIGVRAIENISDIATHRSFDGNRDYGLDAALRLLFGTEGIRD